MIHGLPLYCQSFPPVFSQHTRYKKTAFRITLVTKRKSALPVQNDRKRADLHLCNKIISTKERATYWGMEQYVLSMKTSKLFHQDSELIFILYPTPS